MGGSLTGWKCSRSRVRRRSAHASFEPSRNALGANDRFHSFPRIKMRAKVERSLVPQSSPSLIDSSSTSTSYRAPFR